MTWKTDQLQAVLFTNVRSDGIDALKAWSLLFSGASPDAFNKVAVPVVTSTAEGAVGRYQLKVSVQPNRIDLFLSGNAESTFPIQLPRIDNLADASKLIAKYCTVLSTQVSLIRAALVGSFTQEVSNKEDVSQLVSSASGRAAFPAGSTDCVYQFNLRSKSPTLIGIEYNRILTWGMGAFQITSEPDQSFIPTAGGIPLFYSRTVPVISLKADINTHLFKDITNDAETIFTEMKAELVKAYDGTLAASL